MNRQRALCINMLVAGDFGACPKTKIGAHPKQKLGAHLKTKIGGTPQNKWHA